MHVNAKYDECYRSMLDQVTHSRLTDAPLTAFWPSAGPSFSDGPRFLFVGRATNGWAGEHDGPHFQGRRAPTVDRVNAYPAALAAADEDGNELSWVEKDDDRFYRRAFWSMIREFVSNDDADWASSWTMKVAWTNLYKIAPAKGGNPSEKLREVQLPHCRELLRLEIGSLRPDAIIFFTGDAFYRDFADDGSIPIPKREKSAVGGKFCRRPAVLLPHPVRAYRLGVGNAKAWQLAEPALRMAGWNP